MKRNPLKSGLAHEVQNDNHDYPRVGSEWVKLMLRQQVQRQIDEIATKIWSYIQATYPNHPICQLPPKPMESRRQLESTLWNALETMEILDSVNYVVFNQVKFHFIPKFRN